MTLLFVDGCDHYATADIAKKWTQIWGDNSVYANITTGRNGNGIGITTNDWPSCYVRRYLGATYDTLILGCAFNSGSTVRNTDGGSGVAFFDGTSPQIGFGVDSSSKIFVMRGFTSINRTGFSITPGAWYYMELKAKIHHTLGTYDLRMNGTSILSGSGDTNYTGNAYADGIGFYHINNGFATFAIDDIYVCSTTGTYNTDFLGDIKVETIRPTGVGAHTDFTPSAGANWQNVDDTTQDGDSTYNQSYTVDHIDTFEHGNLTTTSGTIKGIQINTVARKTDSGARTMRHITRCGAPADYESASMSMFDSYTYDQSIREEDPSDSTPFTIADINAAEFGYKVQS